MSLVGLLVLVRLASVAAPPRLFPDYCGVTLPPNIAPLNFRIEEPGTRYRVRLRSTHGDAIEIAGRHSTMRIPAPAWRALLAANAGEPLCFEISVLNQGAWNRFETVTNFVAREPVDSHLVYRLLKPLYNIYVHLGIYQRDLESFVQRPVLENRQFGHACLNCHTFWQQQPGTFAFNIRSPTNGQPLMLVVSNRIHRINQTMGYLSWHPSGRLLTFSANKFSLLRHTTGETREVYDAASDLRVYRVDSNTLVSPPAIAMPGLNETWPCWSPDGRSLYYCRAPAQPVGELRQIRYDLMAVSYDPEQDRWGQPEQVLPASLSRLSACEPRISPDGRWLVVTLCQYGNFPPYQASSDLYVVDLQSNRARPVEVNSDAADTWHSWSSNSRWLVFSSKRLDGLFARPFFSYVDAQGRFHKPFLLPQEDPAFYDTCLENFNLPELVRGAVQVASEDLARAVLSAGESASGRVQVETPGDPYRAAHE